MDSCPPGAVPRPPASFWKALAVAVEEEWSQTSEPQWGPRALSGHVLSFHSLSETRAVFHAKLVSEFTNIVVHIIKSVRFIQKRALLCAGVPIVNFE